MSGRVSWNGGGSSTSGTGSQQIEFDVTRNSSQDARSGELTVSAGAESLNVVVEQAGRTCKLVSGSTQIDNVPGSGSQFEEIYTFKTPECAAEAAENVVANSDWIGITEVLQGSDAGTRLSVNAVSVSASAAPNSGAAREGALSVGGNQVMVSQESGSCAVQTSLRVLSGNVTRSGSDPLHVDRFGARLRIGVNVSDPSCNWEVSNVQGDGLYIYASYRTSPVRGYFTMQVTANNTDQARTGRFAVAGELFMIEQDAGLPMDPPENFTLVVTPHPNGVANVWRYTATWDDPPQNVGEYVAVLTFKRRRANGTEFGRTLIRSVGVENEFGRTVTLSENVPWFRACVQVEARGNNQRFSQTPLECVTLTYQEE